MKAVAITLAGMLVACGPAETRSAGPDTPPTTSAAAEPAVELSGEWRVAGLDGAEIDKPYAIALSADPLQIWWQPACAMQYRAYTIAGNRFEAVPRDNANTEVCDIGFPEELPAIWSALEAADRIERTPENGVLISGSERSVLLFSQ